MLTGFLLFDEAEHRYSVGDVVLPSVTSIIRPVAPDLSSIPRDVLERKRALGQAVHLACELDDNDELDEAGLDDVLRPYLAAWRKFKADNRVRIVKNEQQLYHPTLRYAGTLDRMAWLEAVAPENWLLDLKTVADPSPAYGVQLSGYKGLVEANGEPVQDLRRGSVHLRDDATYKLHEYRNPNDDACFRALLSVHHWKESNT